MSSSSHTSRSHTSKSHTSWSHTSGSPSIIITESLQEQMLSEMDIHNGSFNILLIGPSQAGKSTLVEAIKKYSDPTTPMDKSSIGAGVSSHTNDVQETIITTTLPAYKVFQSSDTKDEGRGNGIKRNVVQLDLLYNMAIDDYEDEIDRRQGLHLQQTNKMGAKYRHFCIYDTPGLNDTNSFDESHVEKIFSVLSNIKAIHLVLMVIGPTPFTPGLKTALKNYIDIFPSFNDILAFVHTKIDYKGFHPGSRSFHSSMALKASMLEELTGSNTVPCFMIDCNLHRPTPIRECITQNIIRKILRLATFNKPVVMDRIVVRKTQRMKEIDKIISDKVASIIRTSSPTVMSQGSQGSDPQEGHMSQIYNLNAKKRSLQDDLQKTKEYLRANDNDDLTLLYENRYDQGWSISVTQRERYMVFRSQGCIIDKKVIMSHNITNLREDGGEKLDFWEAQFERKAFQEGLFHVKLYAKKRNKYREEIYEHSTKMFVLKEAISRLERTIEDLLDRHRDHCRAISAMTNKYNENMGLLKMASSQFLIPDVFKSLIQSKAYSQSLTKDLDIVENVYLKFIRSPVQSRNHFKHEDYSFSREDSDSDDESGWTGIREE